MTDRAPEQIAVLGAGSWGTALALLLCRNGHGVRLWGHDPAHIDALTRERENRAFLPGFALPPALTPTADIAAALPGATAVLVVVPSQFFGDVLAQLAPALPDGLGVCWATKGFEPDSGRLLHEVAHEHLGPRELGILSGPSFAREVAGGLPTAITVAASTPAFAQRLADLVHAPRFRAYTQHDLIGVQVGGAAKNVIAIATGIADGLGFGANTRAALITRGLAEIMRLGEALGARRETLMGLAGLGDLVLTCTDDQSRNRRLGLALAAGRPAHEAMADIGQEVEGVVTARAVHALAARCAVEMPISAEVHAVLYAGRTPEEATQRLLERASKSETED
ncbi:NAD(P)H-dependent glycerol-3-phosphate dehydrogenase [uncultured Thiohalocapsa sp.]|uniref:NAD(P)H-dependent glycerol-3-phosphate dehydrogenase n=1 Tax=uncultured Thiohalocapsa sp. TaxID=768990 RepID=UPI0025E91170|nr:NAD(P)H-dependent glycerol-3-phosphate dehydrogenase [uncultured Thiohalocapsa sp.]